MVVTLAVISLLLACGLMFQHMLLLDEDAEILFYQHIVKEQTQVIEGLRGKLGGHDACNS